MLQSTWRDFTAMAIPSSDRKARTHQWLNDLAATSALSLAGRYR